MRIALISRGFWQEHEDIGGEGGTAEQLATTIQSAGHEIIALSQSPHVENLVKSNIGQIETWLLPMWKRGIPTAIPDKVLKQLYGYRKLMTDALALRRFLRERGPFDVLWALCEEPDGLICGFAAKLGEIPPLFILMYSLRYRFENGNPVFTQHRHLQLGFKKASLIAANSPMTAELLRSQYGVPGNKLSWIPPNLTRNFLRASDETSLSPRKERDRIIFLGALNEKKGADVFIEAAGIVSRGKENIEFVMIGGGTEKNPAYQMRCDEVVRKSGLETSLKILGRLAPADVIRQIKQSRLAVLPARIDEFSRATVECLALGVPVVVTESTGAAYIPARDGSGVVVPPNDARALARGMETVLQDPGYSARAAEKAEKIRTEFSPEYVAGQMIELLSKAARK